VHLRLLPGLEKKESGLLETLRRTIVTGVVLVLMILPVQGFAAGAPSAPAGSQTKSVQPNGQPVLGDDTTIVDLLSQIRVPDRTSRTFSDLFSKHQAELDRLVRENPWVMWDSLGVVLDALPAFRQLAENEGRLLIDRRVYARAANLMERLEILSSPQLTRDLRQSQKYVEDRMKESGPNTLEIDLN
jgi:hypothetical protein